MKKIILLLAVLLMTAPALAEVVVTVTDAGDNSGWATIAYDVNGEPDFVRAFALDITTDGNNIVEIDSISGDYWVFPGTIDINDEGEVNDAGSPVAPNDAPGALGGLGTSGITIEMGALFPEGDPAPDANGVLLRIRVDATSDVCVVGNPIRGKVVMKNADSDDPFSVCQEVVVAGADPCPCTIYGDIAGKPWINGGAPDGLVDSYDVVKIGSVWGMTTADVDWDPCLDVGGKPWINGGAPDGVIDSYDVVKIGSYWGIPCSL